MSAPPVACIIPALDAASTVAGVAHGVRAHVPGALIIGVDDGSRDGTRGAMLAACDRVIAFEGNAGKGAALRAGIGAALAHGAWAVLTIDADGQHDPAAAPALLAALAGADLAIGTRARRGTAMPFGRRMTNALASAAVGRILRAPVPDPQSGFRAMRRAVCEAVQVAGDRFEYETEFLIAAGRAGFRIAAVPVPTRYGAPSHFRPLRDSARVVGAIWRQRTAGRR
ncbi:MAG TPA: glycosyltransferase family 2 protein [Gemmatimonadaceae bacterium]|nr:glycosyltransferase family 2 protein [Gemmatimonadaceae bacterium]